MHPIDDIPIELAKSPQEMDKAKKTVARASDYVGSIARDGLLFEFLQGQCVAWGVFEDRFARLRRRFTASVKGCWQGDEFELTEIIRHANGQIQTREWRYGVLQDGVLRGTSLETIGFAYGLMSKHDAQLNYKMRTLAHDRPMTVSVYDRYFRLDNASMMNRGTVKKFGIKLGEITVFYRRLT